MSYNGNNPADINVTEPTENVSLIPELNDADRQLRRAFMYGHNAVAIKTASYQLTDLDHYVIFNGTALTATLPTVNSISTTSVAREYIIANAHATENVVVATQPGDSCSVTLIRPGESVTFFAIGGTQWAVFNRIPYATAADVAGFTENTLYAVNADTLDTLHAGNASGNIPINNGTINTNLNAEKLGGQNSDYHKSRANHTGTQDGATITGTVPLAAEATHAVNADHALVADTAYTTIEIGQATDSDTVDMAHAGNQVGNVALNNGIINLTLDADLLDDQHGSYYRNPANLISGTLPGTVIVPAGNISGKVASCTAADTATTATNATKVLDSGSGLYVDAKSIVPTVASRAYTADACTGNAASATNATTVSNGLYSTGTYNNPSWLTALAGTKITGAVASATSANSATTVTNGIYTTDRWNDPVFITGLAGSKIVGAVSSAASATSASSCSGNAATATTASNTTNLNSQPASYYVNSLNHTGAHGAGCSIAATQITGTIVASSCTGNAATVTNGVVTTGMYNDPAWLTGVSAAKISGTVASATTATNATNATNATTASSCSGNAATVTNGLYSTGSYNNPSWLTGLAGSKVTEVALATKTSVYDWGSRSTSFTLDMSLSHCHIVNVTGNITITVNSSFTNDRCMVVIKNGNYTVTLSGIDTDSPTLTKAASTQDYLALVKSFGKVACVSSLLNKATV